MSRKIQCFVSLCLAAAIGTMVSIDAGATTLPSQSQHQQNRSREWLLDYHADLKKNLDKRAYEHLVDSDRKEIARAQDRVLAILSGVKSIKDLNGEQEAELWNEHSKVVAVLEAREDQRVICERVRVIGTNLPTTRCLTVAERERRRKEAADMMRDQKGFVKTPRGN
jgi:hypothetical protein